MNAFERINGIEKAKKGFKNRRLTSKGSYKDMFVSKASFMSFLITGYFASISFLLLV